MLYDTPNALQTSKTLKKKKGDERTNERTDGRTEGHRHFLSCSSQLKIETNLYIKPSNLQLYLDYFSNHPQPCKEGLVYGQALRILERCSKPEWRDQHLENLRGKLQERNYPNTLISEKFSKAKEKSRKELIFQNRSRRQGDDKVRLIFTHNGGNPPPP